MVILFEEGFRRQNVPITLKKSYWDFDDCVKLLEQIKIIDKDLKSDLLAFKSGRNSVAHWASSQIKKGMNKAAKDQFQKGANAYKKLSKILDDMINEFEVKVN